MFKITANNYSLLDGGNNDTFWLFQFLPLFTILGSFYPAGVCSVWGGSTYNTFDGKSYRFNKECSYYLVKEIITKYNLTITLNKHDCDPSDNTFCTQALTVTYQSYEVVLTRRLKTSGTEANAVSTYSKCQYICCFSVSVSLYFEFTNLIVVCQ